MPLIYTRPTCKDKTYKLSHLPYGITVLPTTRHKRTLPIYITAKGRWTQMAGDKIVCAT